ncbi:unnamed protein product, partial [Meganyctiphanes norvegica]
PISLICVDTKLLSKLIAHRVKKVLYKCVSQEQYCGKEKSIVECNNTTRDLFYYINENKETGALINIDLQKAFDSVDHSFLFKVMRQMGFSDTLIGWIKILYKDIMSICLVNGHQGDAFKVKRGVRQGCPLSMIMYVIAQEPLYQAIKKTQQIKSINTPCKEIKLLGFADDSSFFVKSDISIVYIFTILKHFELASSIKLNINKTKIIGFGNWQGRTQWPYADIKVEISDISILGITYAHSLDHAVDISWSNIVEKMRQRIRILSQRSFTIF